MIKTIFAFMLTLSLFTAEAIERPAVMSHIVAASTNITTTYAGAGGTAFSNLASATEFVVLNDTAGDIAIAVPDVATGCTGSVDHFIVPAGLGFAPDQRLAINKHICIRSLTGASIVAGDVWVSAY